jgi:hypothetical protein
MSVGHGLSSLHGTPMPVAGQVLVSAGGGVVSSIAVSAVSVSAPLSVVESTLVSAVVSAAAVSAAEEPVSVGPGVPGSEEELHPKRRTREATANLMAIVCHVPRPAAI